MARKTTWTLAGIGAGAGLMYFLDPDRGRRRRALARDQAHRGWRRSGEAIDTTVRNLRDRVTGLAAATRTSFGNEETISDDVLVARVRSKIGRSISHPHAIQVMSREGVVTLSGPVLEDEVARLLATVESVRGIKGVEHRLEVHHDRDIPALQGGSSRVGSQWEVWQTNWSPSLRFVMSVAGSGLAAFGLGRGGAMGVLAASAGAGVLTRALTNLELKRLFGVGAAGRAVEIHKTINIDAPVEDVCQFWSRVENFPKFMTHVREVYRTGEGRSHWVARGPAGLSMEWDAVVTREEPNRLIAWGSAPGAAVENAGWVRFQPNAKGGTQVDIQLSYNPPGGALGHAVAAIFGSDPKRAMDEDLIRLKSLLEFDKTTAAGHTVTRGELDTPSNF